MASSAIGARYDDLIEGMDKMSLESQENQDQIRIVLLGKTGSGKSSTGNTIIGRRCFKEDMSPISVTNKCSVNTFRRFADNREIRIIDTPGLFDTHISLQVLKTEISRCIILAAPGPHVFLLVIRLERLTKEDEDTVHQLQEIFGEEAKRFTIVVFTGRDELDRRNMSIEDYIARGGEFLTYLIRTFPYVAFNNTESEKQQVDKLFGLIHNKFAIDYYSSTDFKEAKVAVDRKREQERKEEQKKIEMYFQPSRSRNESLRSRINSSSRENSMLQSNLREIEMQREQRVTDFRMQQQRIQTELMEQNRRFNSLVESTKREQKSELENGTALLHAQRDRTARIRNIINDMPSRNASICPLCGHIHPYVYRRRYVFESGLLVFRRKNECSIC